MVTLENKYFRYAIIFSAAFHVFLLSLFFLIKVDWKYKLTEFTEIAFVSREKQAIKKISDKNNNRNLIPDKDQTTSPSTVVNLPQRKMLEFEQPLLKLMDINKKINSDDDRVLLGIKHADNRIEMTDVFSVKRAAGQKLTAMPGGGLSVDEKIIPKSSQMNVDEANSEMPYKIEGQASRRIVAYKVIHEYPKNLQRQAQVKIGFTVLPNGRIGEMIPLIKADAQLEKVTLDALRQWKFNSLSQSEPHRIETGVITFRYVLK